MLFFINPDLGVLQEPRGLNPLRLANPQPQPEREPLRHILIGSADGVRQTIHTLHKLNYVEQHAWSKLIQVPTTGILITPEQGEVMSYLIRYRLQD